MEHDHGHRLPGDLRHRGRTLSREARSDADAGRSIAKGMMNSELFNEAYASLQHNRRRTTLTMMGMAWGIATVVLLLAYGTGFERAIENIFANFGNKIIRVWPGRTTMQAGGEKAGSPIRLKIEDVDLLKNSVPLIRHITPRLNKEAVIQRE